MKILLWILVLYAAYGGFIFLLQRHMMFPAFRAPALPLGGAGLPGLEKLRLDLPFGQVEAWYLPTAAGQEPGPAVIFAHGNGELIDYWPQELLPFNRMGLGVLLVEYPGYGRSAGSPSRRSIGATFAAAYDRLLQMPAVDPNRIVLYGRSIGGAAVCDLAAARPSAALILMSTFTSVRSFAKRFLLPPLLIRDPFDNLAVVKSYAKPVLIVHGRHDEVVPYRHGLELRRAARNATMLSYDCGHNDCLPGIGSFWRDAEAFLRKAAVLQVIRER